jgi:AraC-like DNA-binding protein
MMEYDLLAADSFRQATLNDGVTSSGGALAFSSVARRSDEGKIGRIFPRDSEAFKIGSEIAEARLLHFEKHDQVELEFLLHKHLVIFFPDGVLGDVEWSNEAGTRRAPSSPASGIAFNPSGEYLRLRVRKIKYEFRVLFLQIGPTLFNRMDDKDGNASFLDLKQRIDLEVGAVAETLRSLCEELKYPGAYSGPYVYALVMLAFASLMRNLSSREIGGPSMCAKGGLASWQLKRALELLEDNLSEAPTLAELARALKLHPTSVCRAFKQSTGLTPHRYLLLCRVNRAKEMMKNSDRALTEIALDCGFNGSSQFSVVFKRIEGISPRLFKRSAAAGRSSPSHGTNRARI